MAIVRAKDDEKKRKASDKPDREAAREDNRRKTQCEAQTKEKISAGDLCVIDSTVVDALLKALLLSKARSEALEPKGNKAYLYARMLDLRRVKAAVAEHGRRAATERASGAPALASTAPQHALVPPADGVIAGKAAAIITLEAA
eukprot:jgi/Tetstr1/431619/TSEL_021149.t1